MVLGRPFLYRVLIVTNVLKWLWDVVGQNLRCLFVDGYHSTVVFLEGFLGVHRGTGVLTHSQMYFLAAAQQAMGK